MLRVIVCGAPRWLAVFVQTFHALVALVATMLFCCGEVSEGGVPNYIVPSVCRLVVE